MKLTTNISYTLKFQVTDEDNAFGPVCDTLQLAVAQWDIANSQDCSKDYVIMTYVTKEIK